MSAADFRGEVIWGDDCLGRDYTGRRVAVLAPGREAAGIVPAVARTAAAVKLFQETPAWLLPVGLRLPRRLAIGVARVHLRVGVADPWTRRLLTPDRRFEVARPRAGRAFYAALKRPNCKLIAWPVYAIVADGVRTAEGIEHHADCLVIATTSRFAVADGVARPREERTA